MLMMVIIISIMMSLGRWEVHPQFKSGKSGCTLNHGMEERMGGKLKSLDILATHHGQEMGRTVFTHVPGLR